MFLSSYAFHFSVKALGQITTCFSVVLGALTSILPPKQLNRGLLPSSTWVVLHFWPNSSIPPSIFSHGIFFSLFYWYYIYLFFLLLKFNLPRLKNQNDCICEVSIRNSLFPHGTRILIQRFFFFSSSPLWAVTAFIYIYRSEVMSLINIKRLNRRGIVFEIQWKPLITKQERSIKMLAIHEFRYKQLFWNIINLIKKFKYFLNNEAHIRTYSVWDNV